MKKFVIVPIALVIVCVLFSCSDYDVLVDEDTCVDESLIYLQCLDVGSIIVFGQYYWRILEIQEERALIITENLISQQPFANNHSSSSWEDSNMRRWLNSDFYYTFDDYDRSYIFEVTVANYGNPWFETAVSLDTVDKIFILSIDEILRYLGGEYQGEITTDDTYSSGITGIWDELDNERVALNMFGLPQWWWLRSAGQNDYHRANVLLDGSINLQGISNNTIGGVRPALWIDLEFFD